MLTSELDYHLPRELIAQDPAARRGESTLLIVDPAQGAIPVVKQGMFSSTLLDELRPDDLVVVNDSRVVHARVKVTRPGGGGGELLLLHPVGVDGTQPLWEAMARPGRRLREGMALQTRAEGGVIRCHSRRDDGNWIVALPVAEQHVYTWLERVGDLPLPPYIEPHGQAADRYQTVYAREPGSVAAPTAGLHFDTQLWQEVHERCDVAEITLHVGAGTFQPVRVDDLSDHAMHAERYSISAASDARIRAALAACRRVVAVGTTSVRVLETVYASDGQHRAELHGTTRLMIEPGHRFQAVGGLLTNFHLPRSTLIALVMAFAGVQATRKTYAHAIEQELRFYSFGDAMFVRSPAAQTELR